MKSFTILHVDFHPALNIHATRTCIMELECDCGTIFQIELDHDSTEYRELCTTITNFTVDTHSYHEWLEFKYGELTFNVHAVEAIDASMGFDQFNDRIAVGKWDMQHRIIVATKQLQ